MYSIFRDNDPTKLIFVFLLIFIFRFSLTDFDTMTVSELTVFIVGERIKSGDLMYADLWETLPPLSSLVYAVLYAFFGKTKLILFLAGSALFVYQSLFVSRIMSRREILHEKNYIPFVVFVALNQFSVESFLLTPQMMSFTALLPAFNIVVNSDKESNDFELLKVGFWVSLAALFDGIMTFSLLWFLFAVSNFRGMSLRHFSLMIYGYALPFIALFLLYMHKNQEDFLIQNYFFPLTETISNINLANLNFFSLLTIYILPVFIALMKILFQRSLTSYQGSVFLVMIFWLLFIGILTLSENYQNTSNLIYLTFPASFLIPKWLRNIRKNLWRETAFLFVVFSSFSLLFLQVKDPFKEHISYAVRKVAALNFSDKKILVLGENRDFYLNNYAVTPFLNWQLSKIFWQKSNTYETVSEIVKVISTERPEMVIDEEGFFRNFIIQTPVVAQMYEEQAKGIYVLRK